MVHYMLSVSIVVKTSIVLCSRRGMTSFGKGKRAGAGPKLLFHCSISGPAPAIAGEWILFQLQPLKSGEGGKKRKEQHLHARWCRSEGGQMVRSLVKEGVNEQIIPLLQWMH